MQVAYIGRKDTQAPLIEKIIKSHDPTVADIPFIKIENLAIHDYAHVLKQSAIFLSTSLHEGVNRSILEAMACGCLCAGYHGIGGLDYIVGEGDRQNFILAEGGHFIDLAHKLTGLITMLRQDDPKVDAIRAHAFETAGRFTLACEQESILDFWKAFATQMPVV
jgi:glycosyltransferase involved in cell wall biosynthesis